MSTLGGSAIVDVGFLKCRSYDGQVPSDKASMKASTDPFSRLLWKPDITHLSSNAARAIFPPLTSRSEVGPLLEQLDRLSTLILSSISDLYTNDPSLTIVDHLRPFIAWAHRCSLLATKIDSPDLPGNTRSEAIEDLVQKLKDIPEARLIKRIFDHLPEIVSGEKSGVQIAQEGDLLTDVYAQGVGFTNAYHQLHNVLDLIAHKNPSLRMIEVGAGTGGATTGILETLAAGTGSKRYRDYTFTDVTPSFLTTAKERFGSFKDISFRTLDVENDPENQGFEPAAYDLVIASEVLHATDFLAVTIQNVRKLLKPGGRLILLELTRPPKAAGLLVGTFPFYWKGQTDGRLDGPFATQERWNEELLGNGFSGVDILLSDHPEGLEIASVMVTTAVDTKPRTNGICEAFEHQLKMGNPILLLSRLDPSPAALAVETNLRERNIPCKHAILSEFSSTSTRHVVSFLDLEGAASIHEEPTTLADLRAFLTNASSLLWLSGYDVRTGSPPAAAIAMALLQTIQREMPHVTMSQICAAEGTEIETVVSLVTSQILSSLGKTLSKEEYEIISIHEDLVHISRLVLDSDLNSQYRAQEKAEVELITKPVGQLGPVKVAFEQQGVPSTIRFDLDMEMHLPLPDDWIEIKSEAIEMNMKDLAVLTGRFDWNTYSLSCCGIVSRLGVNVKHLQLGDRVAGIAFGNFGNYTRTCASSIQQFAKSESPKDLASLPISYLTAVYALNHIARLRAGETVLILSATSSLGLALRRLARHIGADIYVTAGNDTKAEELQSLFDIPRKRIFPSRSADTWQQIMKQTDGIEVICSSASGEHMQDSWRCIAPMGRYVELGRLDVLNRGRLAMDVFERNATFTSFDISLLYTQKRSLVDRLMGEVASLYHQGIVRPIDKITTFDVSKFEQAMNFMAKGNHIGKVVITYENPESRLKLAQSAPVVSLDPKAAYILVGCSGTGVGSVISSWMVARGAKYLVHLSRSSRPGAMAAGSSFDDSLNTQKVESVAMQCDITDEQSLRSAIATVAKTHTIKGVIHAAAVFEDINFETQSFAQLQKVLDPKVKGTLNLHQATLDQPLDFFIMTSSVIAVVNTATQSSYSAANSFQDSFAQFRRSSGLPAQSLALGMISEVGFASRSSDIQKSLNRNGLYGTSPDELRKLLDIAVTDGLKTSKDGYAHSDAHLLTGLDPVKIYELDPTADFPWSIDPRFSHIVRAIEDIRNNRNAESADATSKSSIADVGDLFKLITKYSSNEKGNEGPPSALYDLANEVLSARLAKLLFLSPDEIDVEQDLSPYGIDSMVAAELRSWLTKSFGLNVSFGELIAKGMKIATLGRMVVDKAVSSSAVKESI